MTAGTRLTATRVEIDPDDDPIQSLAKIAKAEQDVDIQEALLNAKSIFEAEMARRNIIEGRSARSVMQGGFLAARSYFLTLRRFDACRCCFGGKSR